MKSMTGFGRGQANLLGGTLLLELSSVNHRHIDVRAHLPRELGAHGLYLEQQIRTRRRRGRFELWGRWSDSPLPALSAQKLSQFYRALRAVQQDVCPSQELRFEAMLSLPGVAEATNETNSTQERQALLGALEEAWQALEQMRAAEGEALKRELAGLVQELSSSVDELSKESSQWQIAHFSRLSERVARLVDDPTLNPERARLELAFVADRADLTEELARMNSHLDQFRNLLTQQEAVGRRLDFIAQELSREANTLSAKCNQATATGQLVELRALVERVREQSQNVE